MNITKKRNLWFSIGFFLMAISIGLLASFGLRMGLDFSGGSRWDLSFPNGTPTQQLLVETIESHPSITQDIQVNTTDDGNFLVTVQDLPDTDIESLKTEVQAKLGEFETHSYQKVDSKIGGSFKRKAIYAIIATLIGIIFFVAFTFRNIPRELSSWRFGGIAIFALAHDILIVLGVFVVLGLVFKTEVDLTFITALLATLGFSVNDTIVILDRVRENVNRTPGTPLEENVENAIQQTLRRSINTSVSTLLPLLALVFFGADSIFFFVLALSIGIFAGTYSSIFLVAPGLVWLNERFPVKEANEQEAEIVDPYQEALDRIK